MRLQDTTELCVAPTVLLYYKIWKTEVHETESRCKPKINIFLSSVIKCSI